MISDVQRTLEVGVLRTNPPGLDTMRRRSVFMSLVAELVVVLLALTAIRMAVRVRICPDEASRARASARLPARWPAYWVRAAHSVCVVRGGCGGATKRAGRPFKRRAQRALGDVSRLAAGVSRLLLLYHSPPRSGSYSVGTARAASAAGQMRIALSSSTSCNTASIVVLRVKLACPPLRPAPAPCPYSHTNRPIGSTFEGPHEAGFGAYRTERRPN